jgi:hypothetical protein
MYLIEHVMKDLKGYIINMCKSKGCMVEGHVFNEALGLCTKYMQTFDATRGVFGMIMRKEWLVRFLKVCQNHNN